MAAFAKRGAGLPLRIPLFTEPSETFRFSPHHLKSLFLNI
jgi:hypothetical protein